MTPNTPIERLEKELKDQIERRYGVSLSENAVHVEDTPNRDVGDLGLSCFSLAKIIKQSPVSIAEGLAKASFNSRFVTAVKSAGPYLNLFINMETFLEELHESIIKKPDTFGKSEYGAGKQVMIEYSAPNSNKPQHLGHVRNNVLGMAIANILEEAGYSVKRVNLINDRGIHICKSMYAYRQWGNDETPQSRGQKGDHFVGDYYTLFEQKTSDDPDLMDKARELLQKWEDGDTDVVSLWEKMNTWVYEGFDETYERMGCSFDKVYYESKTYRKGREIVLKALESNKVRKNDKGEVVVDLKDFEMEDKVLLRSDGTSIYITQDIGTTVEKFNDFDLDKAVWVVASEQNLHFQILFHVLEKLGYPWAEKCYHLNYGMVYLPEGKLKSREGKVINADTLMDELHELARKEMTDRSREMTDEELEDAAEKVGLGALKYYILKFIPLKDIHFSPEDSLSFDGSTGPFAQYSYARLSSILRKGGDRLSGDPDFSRLGNPEEKNIVLLLARYPRIVLDSAKAYNPAKIVSWIFDISRAINKFHHDHSVLNTNDAELTIARGVLIAMARQILGNGLKLLGIEPLERM